MIYLSDQITQRKSITLCFENLYVYYTKYFTIRSITYSVFETSELNI